MKSPRLLPSLLAAALLCAVGSIAAPRLYGGGGDDGVDILPWNSGGQRSDGGARTNVDGLGKPQLGYVTIHGNGRVHLEGGYWVLPGLLTSPHRLSDIFLGQPGSEPWKNRTALDVFAKGSRAIGAAEHDDQLHLAGRFEFEDLDTQDGESLKLIGRPGWPATLGVVGGQRSTHEGKIWASFSRIDWIVVNPLPNGHINLMELRDSLIDEYAGSGIDIAVGLVTQTPNGLRVVWAAFNVDDTRAIYDIEAPLR